LPCLLQGPERIPFPAGNDSREKSSNQDNQGPKLNAYVITTGRAPEKLTEKITAIPWQYL
jgi:hypothetical protein